MQAEAAQIIEQTGVVDKLLGPSGGFVLALPEPLGVTMGRLELMMLAIAKKAGAATPQQSSPGTSTQSNLQMMDGDEDGGVSMF